MNSNKYRDIILDEINEGLSSNYIKTVGRQLTIFSSFENKTLYIESKTQRIMEDYSINDSVIWKNNKTGNVLYNKKNNIISFSSKNIENNMQNYITDIPYFVAMHFYKIIKEQDLIEFSFDDWLRFFTFRFFNKDILSSNNKIEMILDTPFSQELQKSPEYKSIDRNTVRLFSGEKNKAFFAKSNNQSYFYMSFGSRHHLFKIN